MSELVERLNEGVIVIGHGPGMEPLIDVVTANQAMREAATALAERDARIAELTGLLRLCLPKNVCLTNNRWPDDTNVPLDVPLGDLRKIATTLKGEVRP